MGKRDLLEKNEIGKALEKLPGWSYEEGRLRREYRFADFVHAFGFMAAAAAVCERMNHHPAWSNVWNRVKVELYTHDAGGVTGMDIELAGKMESLARKLL